MLQPYVCVLTPHFSPDLYMCRIGCQHFTTPSAGQGSRHSVHMGVWQGKSLAYCATRESPRCGAGAFLDPGTVRTETYLYRLCCISFLNPAFSTVLPPQGRLSLSLTHSNAHKPRGLLPVRALLTRVHVLAQLTGLRCP